MTIQSLIDPKKKAGPETLQSEPVEMRAKEKAGQKKTKVQTSPTPAPITAPAPVVKMKLTIEKLKRNLDLITAAKKGDADGMRNAIAHGADKDFQHRDMTPLMWAAGKGNEKAAKYLIDLRAAVNEQNRFGETALARVTMMSGSSYMVKMMIQYWADPNLPDKNGMTPLMHAIERGYRFAASELVDGGADTSLRDNKGRTAMSIAKEEGKDAIASDIKLKKGDIE